MVCAASLEHCVVILHPMKQLCFLLCLIYNSAIMLPTDMMPPVYLLIMQQFPADGVVRTLENVSLVPARETSALPAIVYAIVCVGACF